jgi:hypothetical protein
MLSIADWLKDISLCLAARSTVGFWDEVLLSDLIELYLTKGALPLAKL